jgi:hypothetical protein
MVSLVNHSDAEVAELLKNACDRRLFKTQAVSFSISDVTREQLLTARGVINAFLLRNVYWYQNLTALHFSKRDVPNKPVFTLAKTVASFFIKLSSFCTLFTFRSLLGDATSWDLRVGRALLGQREDR